MITEQQQEKSNRLGARGFQLAKKIALAMSAEDVPALPYLCAALICVCGKSADMDRDAFVKFVGRVGDAALGLYDDLNNGG